MQTLTAPKRIRLDLHPAQLEIHASSARFRVAATGRRFGKTTVAIGEHVVYGYENPGSLGWWVAPVYQQSQIAFRMLLSMLPPSTRTVNRADREVTLWNGSVIAFKSADRPDNLRGEGVGKLTVDEAAYVKEETWQASLRPTLSDTNGEALLIGTFDGENYFYDLYQRGQDPGYPEWESWRFPTSANPFIPASEIEEARRTLPEGVFEQEYMANPLIYVGAVFPGEKVQAAAERLEFFRDDLPTFAGLDWGYAAATAFEVCQEDSEGRIAWLDERSWVATQLETRVSKIAELCRSRRIEAIYADAAGASENAALKAAIIDADLRTEVIAVPFGKRLKNGETAKDAGIKTRRWFLENDLESMSKDVPELIRTTKRYHYREGTEDVEKIDDHPVDAATAFYASRRHRVVEER